MDDPAHPIPKHVGEKGVKDRREIQTLYRQSSPPDIIKLFTVFQSHFRMI